MVEEPESGHDDDPNKPHSFFQNFHHTPVGARVLEKVGRGVFSTAVMILQTHEIFVLDFLSMMVPPQTVVARIIMTTECFSQFLEALRVNVRNYETHVGPLAVRTTTGQGGPPSGGEADSAMPSHAVVHPPGLAGPMPAMPQTPSAEGGPTSIQDLYEQLKFPEELLGGVFANAVLIRHTSEEFCFDFIANLFPRPVVASRIFSAAGRIPSLLEAMTGSLTRYQQGGAPPPPEPPPEA
jgi:hypothetical protein